MKEKIEQLIAELNKEKANGSEMSKRKLLKKFIINILNELQKDYIKNGYVDSNIIYEFDNQNIKINIKFSDFVSSRTPHSTITITSLKSNWETILKLYKNINVLNTIEMVEYSLNKPRNV